MNCKTLETQTTTTHKFHYCSYEMGAKPMAFQDVSVYRSAPEDSQGMQRWSKLHNVQLHCLFSNKQTNQPNE
jgi:hypothetical protein